MDFTFYFMLIGHSHFDELLLSLSLFNFHHSFLSFFSHTILFGGHGFGKYSQMLLFIKYFSPSHLKFENKIYSNLDKHTHFINISDIHFEVDMGLLGCNSKIIWHDIFTQIIDIISLKPHKKGFIVCKNFHEIHNELLEIFYSYMNVLSFSSAFIQRNFVSNETNNDLLVTNYSKPVHPLIDVKFIIITEHISFIPNNILKKCKIHSFSRPSKEKIIQGIGIQKSGLNRKKIKQILDEKPNFNDENEISNLKEVYSYALMKSKDDIPKDIFFIICDNIIKEIDSLVVLNNNILFNDYSQFRDIIYDILVYNLELLDAIRYILFYYLKKDDIKIEYINDLLNQLNKFMFQYENNYRSFFHLEYFLFYLVVYLKKSKKLNVVKGL